MATDDGSLPPVKKSGEPEHPAKAKGDGPASGLLKSSLVVAVMTMLSRILGLVRDVVIALYFGAGASADAFFVAFKIPNFLRRLFAEGAFAQAFVPVLSEYKTQRGLPETKLLIDSVAGVLGFVLLIITLVAILAAPALTAVFAPGFYADQQKFTLASEMLRITFPYLLFISLTAFAGSILNSYGRFAVPAITPVLLNIVLICSAVWLTPYFSGSAMSLAWGVLIAGMLQMMFQLPFLLRLNLLPRPRLDYRHEGVARILKLMVPALFGVSVSQINLLLDTVLASFLQTGSVSWLYYSDRLSELPLGVIGIAIATVILPALSRNHASASLKEFSATLDWALRSVMIIGLPAALALMVLARPLIITLFYYGEMTLLDVDMSAKSLLAYAMGLQAFMLIKVLATGYFSRQDTKTPVKIGIYAMIANMVLNLILIGPLAHVGLAMATSISAWMNAGLLMWGLVRTNVYAAQKGWPLFLLKLAVANSLMLLAVFLVGPQSGDWENYAVFERCYRMGGVVVAGVVVYFVALFVMGFRLSGLRKKS
jgi:putative peptidoglycan lipid II flippase